MSDLVGIILAADQPSAPPSDAPGGSGTQDQGGGFLGSPIILIVLIFAIFYFLMIRPQSKDRRRREQMVKNAQKGDRIVTTAGIHGEVVGLAEKTVTLRVDDGVRITFDRAAIWQVEPRGGPAEASADAGRDKA